MSGATFLLLRFLGNSNLNFSTEYSEILPARSTARTPDELSSCFDFAIVFSCFFFLVVVVVVVGVLLLLLSLLLLLLRTCSCDKEKLKAVIYF